MLGRQTLQVSDGLPQGEAHGPLAEGAGQNETFEIDEIRPRVQVTVKTCLGIWRELLPEEGDHACLGPPQAVADV